MKKALLILLSVTVALTVRGNTIVFDTFAAGNTYDQNNGYFIGPGVTAEGAKFIAGASGNLATVDLGLTYFSTPDAGVTAFLYGDAGGLPDNTNQTLLGSGIPTAQFGSSNNSVVSFSVIGNVAVTMGSIYWLVLKPADPSVVDIWNSSLTTVGNTSFTDDGTTWNGPFQGELPAFRLTVSDGAANGVPDSHSTFALMLGSVAVLLALRQARTLPGQSGR